MQPIIQNQSFQDIHTFLKWKLSKINPFKTTTSSQSENYFKKISPLRIATPSQSGKCQMSVLLKTTSSWSRNCWKWVLSRPPHPFKVQIVQNKFFKDHLLKWKLSKSVLPRPPHIPEVKIDPYQSFEGQHIPPKWKCWKYILSRLPHHLKV